MKSTKIKPKNESSKRLKSNKKIAHMKSLILNSKMINFKNYAKGIMPQKKD